MIYPDIASLAENYVDLLTPDANCEYDQFVEINLDEVNITDTHNCFITLLLLMDSWNLMLMVHLLLTLQTLYQN